MLLEAPTDVARELEWHETGGEERGESLVEVRALERTGEVGAGLHVIADDNDPAHCFGKMFSQHVRLTCIDSPEFHSCIFCMGGLSFTCWGGMMCMPWP